MTAHSIVTGLRALANLLESNPGLTRPTIHVCARSHDEVDAYARALAAAGIKHRDFPDSACRMLNADLPGLSLFVTHLYTPVPVTA